MVMRKTHQEQLHLFQEVQEVKKALVQQIVQAAEPPPAFRPFPNKAATLHSRDVAKLQTGHCAHWSVTLSKLTGQTKIVVPSA